MRLGMKKALAAFTVAALCVYCTAQVIAEASSGGFKEKKTVIKGGAVPVGYLRRTRIPKAGLPKGRPCSRKSARAAIVRAGAIW
jgi:hypothetical protein